MNGHGLSQSEQRDLLKVFGDLADFAPKQKLRRELEPKLVRRKKIAMFLKNPEAVKLVDETGAELPTEVVVLEDKRLETEEKALQGLIDEVDSKPLDAKRIHHRDLLQALESLGKVTNKKEVEDMVWEVDEDSDGTVSWKEFHLMYVRNQSDDTGLEPSQLFSVVQFLMYDKQNKGEVTLDQTMEMLFKKYGKDKLEAEIKSLFGNALTKDSNAKLKFLDYLKAVKDRSVRVAAQAAAEIKEKYSGAPGLKKR